MKRNVAVSGLSSGLACLVLLMIVTNVGAQGPLGGTPQPIGSMAPLSGTPISSTFTYQGQLNSNGSAVTGLCNLQFGLWDAASVGAQVGLTQTLNAVNVSNGQFNVLLDFGPTVFNGDARWLQLAVQCGNDVGFTPLNPRQALTPTPYAVYATDSHSAAALQNRAVAVLTPTLNQVLKWNGLAWSPSADEVGQPGTGDISGVYAGPGLSGGGATGEVTLTVGFGGTGSASTAAHSDHNHDATYLNEGQAAAGDLSGAYPNPSVSGLQGRSVSSTAPTTGQVLKWNGSAWVPDVDNTGSGGSTYSNGFGLSLAGNVFSVLTSTIQARVSGACGAGFAMNAIGVDGSVTCGQLNTNFWGLAGSAGTNPSINFLGTTDNVSLTLRVNNTPALRIMPNAASPNLIGGYSGNFISSTVAGSVIGGGGTGAYPNRVQANYAVIGGGTNNTASGSYATIGGGDYNLASGGSATIGGGLNNTASGPGSSVNGGYNTASNWYATVAGGDSGTASGDHATIGGGGFNTASAYAATVPGGYQNAAEGDYSFAAGRRAKANHPGAFVWGDSTNADVGSTGSDQFVVRASGGVNLFGVGAATQTQLAVAGLISTTGGVMFPDNTTQTTALYKPTLPGPGAIAVIDSNGSVGRYPSLAVGPDGLVLIAYYDGANGDLKVLHCGNLPCNGGNVITTVDTAGDVGMYASLAIGADGLGLIAYFDNTNADLRVLHCGDALCSSGNVSATIDSANMVGPGAALVIGSDGLGLISYHSQTNADLKVLHCGTVTCDSGNTITVADSGGYVGLHTSITIGADGLGLISYNEIYTLFSPGRLRVLHCGDLTCSTGNTITVVDNTATDVGLYTSITLGADGLGLISYHDATNTDLKVLHCGNPTCNSGNTITTLDSLNVVGRDTSITIGTDDLGLISYLDTTNGDLKVLHCGNVLCNSGNLTTAVDTAGNVGWHTSITLGADGLALIGHFDQATGDLRVFHCANLTCTPHTRVGR